MAINNKTLEVSKSTRFYTILVERDGVKKYIAKNWHTKGFINCTVIINKSKRFHSFKEAEKFKELLSEWVTDIKILGVVAIDVLYSLDEKVITNG